jgi:multidrug efflux pump subunit AcrB
LERAAAHHRPTAGGLPNRAGGSIEESGKANRTGAPLFPIMIALTLITIIFQVRSISMMTLVFATAPLGLIGVIPTLLLFKQPFGINALVGLIALSGILMRNTSDPPQREGGWSF